MVENTELEDFLKKKKDEREAKKLLKMAGRKTVEILVTAELNITEDDELETLKNYESFFREVRNEVNKSVSTMGTDTTSYLKNVDFELSYNDEGNYEHKSAKFEDKKVMDEKGPLHILWEPDDTQTACNKSIGEADVKWIIALEKLDDLERECLCPDCKVDVMKDKEA